MHTKHNIQVHPILAYGLCISLIIPLLAEDSPLGIPLQPSGSVPDLKVLESTEYVIPSEGRSVIVNKVEAPGCVSQPPTTPETQREAGLANLVARATRNTSIQRTLRHSCTVHNETATHIRWEYKGIPYRAWSNVNFHHFAGLQSFVSADGSTRYVLMMGIGNMIPSNAHLNATDNIPPLPSDKPGFVLVQGDPNNADAMADIQALHDKYMRDGAELKKAWEQRTLAARERAAWLKANPPAPQNITIFYSDIQTGQSAAKVVQP